MLNHGLICIDCKLWYRRNDLVNLPKDAVDELLSGNPDWCNLESIRKEVKRVSKGPVLAKGGRTLKRAMDEVNHEGRVAKEFVSANINFVGTNDGKLLMIGDGSELS